MDSVTHWHRWLRWSARGLGLLALGTHLALVISERFGSPATDQGDMLRGLLLIATVGYAVAWRREIEGGTALATIAAALGGFTYIFAGRNAFVASVVMSVPLFVAGGLFFLCGEMAAGVTRTP